MGDLLQIDPVCFRFSYGLFAIIMRNTEVSTMNDEKKRILISVLIAILIGGGLFLGLFSLLLLSPSSQSAELATPIVLTIENPAPTATIVPTLKPEAEEENANTSEEGIYIGSVVQIFNTEGAGLRLRANPGTSSAVQFVGEELEPFSVINGPTEQDGYIWWYLESPYDKNRSGWAAAEFLQLIEDTD